MAEVISLREYNSRRWNSESVKSDLRNAIMQVINEKGVVCVIDAFFGHRDLIALEKKAA